MISRRDFLSTVVPAALTGANPFQRRRLPPIGHASCPALTSSSIAFPQPEAIGATIQRYIPVAPANLGVAVGMASPSLGSRINCIGSLLDQQGSPLQFTTDTPFEIASITKTFVATVYELLSQSGRLGSKTLGQLFGSQLSQQIGNIPLLNLANYTSGLPADNQDTQSTGTVPQPFPASYDCNYTTKDILAFLATASFPITAPGPYTYSNLGFSLLAFALEASAQSNSFGELITNELLIPLGMMKTEP